MQTKTNFPSRTAALLAVLVTILLFYGVYDSFSSLAVPVIKTAFGASELDQGVFNALRSAGALAGSLLSVVLIGRVGARPSLTAGLLLMVAGLAAVAVSGSFFAVMLTSTLLATGCSLMLNGANGCATLFGERGRQTMPLIHACFGIGASLGSLVSGRLLLAPAFGWRGLHWLCLPAIAVCALLTMLVPLPGATAAGAAPAGKALTLRAFLDDRRALCFIVFAVFAGNLETSPRVWGPLYFQDAYGINPAQEGSLYLTVFFLTFTVSRLLLAWMVARGRSPLTLCWISLLGTIALFTIGFLLGKNGIYVIAAGGFFCAGIYPLMMTVFMRMYPLAQAAQAMAYLALITGIFGIGLQYLIGVVNQLLSPAWGFRFCVILAAASLLFFQLSQRRAPASD